METQPLEPFDCTFSRDDFERLVNETFVERVVHLPETDSTNSRALELASAADPAACTLVLADRQTAGRGRGANRWWSSDGALTFSVLLKPDSFGLATHRWPQVSLAAGLAVCEAIDANLPGTNSQLKWPNDIYLSGRKACGILVEANDGRERNLVVGVGVNVNNSLASAPEDLQQKAIALCDVAGRTLSRLDLLVSILARLAAQLDRLAKNEMELQTQWTRRCLLTGRNVEINLPQSHLAGVCQGIDADGALVVETAHGVERCISGEVVRFG